MGTPLPADLPVQVESNDFNDRPSRDFRPDTVITVGPSGRRTRTSRTPVIKDPKEAAANPDLAAMALMAHGEDRPVVEAFMTGLDLVEDGYSSKRYEHAYNIT